MNDEPEALDLLFLLTPLASRITVFRMSAPLFGLVLAGGKSQRMGADKAALSFHGKPQLAWAYELLNSVCDRTFVSVRSDQRDEPTRAALPQIVDTMQDKGPIAGIIAALDAHPNAAWLVLACDLPFLSRETLNHLIEHRDASRVATAYRSSYDRLPEPLCAIWEPSSKPVIDAWIAKGKDCPRKVLINSDTALLDQPDAHALDNINTPEERAAALSTRANRALSS